MEAWIDLYMVCFDSTEQPEWLHVQIATGSILGFVRTGGQGPVEIVVKTISRRAAWEIICVTCATEARALITWQHWNLIFEISISANTCTTAESHQYTVP